MSAPLAPTRFPQIEKSFLIFKIYGASVKLDNKMPFSKE
jgi:hypothetical protein